ncbi:MAG: ATP-binding protein [Paludibacteraceae bacterium]|nr:ATP-binding protein [Paludibacteraceae bacterium]
MKLIDRSHYTNAIAQWLDKGLVIVLTGQRRVGKSMCLRLVAERVAHDLSNNVIFIDKEEHLFDEITTASALNHYLGRHYHADKHNYIFIDEVQDIVEWEHSVRSWIKRPHTNILITGSNSKMLSSDLSTKLAARYIEIPIHELSYCEFLLFHGLEDSDVSLEKYLTWGGLPFLSVLGLDNRQQVTDYIRSVYDAIVLKDIIQREQIRNIPFLMNLCKFMCDNIGKLLSPNSIMKYMRSQGETVSAPLILSYLSYFTNAYLVYRVYRYDIHGKALMENNEKYYFEDIGIRNVLVRGGQSNDIEKRMENVVFMHLLRYGWVVRVGQLRNGEIDFVAEKGERVLYVQVTYLMINEDTEKREFGNLLAIPNNYPKIVVSMNPLHTRSNYEGIQHLHLREFLKMEI